MLTNVIHSINSLKVFEKINNCITNFFTLWIILFSLITYHKPEYFVGLKSLIIPTLGIVMFGMGMTLKVEDFKRVISRPRDIALGIGLQYTVMPIMGFLLAISLKLDPLIAAGIILLGSCPGGTASNVITYLARGDVALSVTLTTVSTLVCPIFIPLLMYVFAKQWIEVPVLKLFISAIEIVIVPVVLGLLVRSTLGARIDKILDFFPSVSTMSIIFIVGVIIASNTKAIATIGLSVVLVVTLHNLFGLFSGYYLARLVGMDSTKARAISIEVGMQNSGLAVALASKHFGVLAALPSALFSVWHNISGSVLAWWWRRY